MRKNNTARHHFFTPSHTKLTVHPRALMAHNTWLKFRPKKSDIHLDTIDKYYKPLVRITPHKKNHFLYFDSFERMSNVFQYESKVSQPFVIITGNDQQIAKMAWSEVLRLCFYRDINHPLLWQHLKEHCAQNTLKELMGRGGLRIESYCCFAGIDIDHYEYQQRGLVQEQKELGLPQDMDWLNG